MLQGVFPPAARHSLPTSALAPRSGRPSRPSPRRTAGARTRSPRRAAAASLAEHLASTGRRGSDLVFGKTAAAPFTSNTGRRHAEKAWATHEPALVPIGLHEARHTYVSLMVEAHRSDLAS